MGTVPGLVLLGLPLIELAGKTYGLLGCGNIGIHTAAIASALGMHVIAYDMRQRDEALQLGVEYVSLDELFARSDVLGLQMPLFPFNTGIINRENIAKMKDGVIIINNSRGQMVVEQDLADALNSGKVAAAGLDVVSTEPIRGDNPLLTAKNCILTPPYLLGPQGEPPAHHGLHRGQRAGLPSGRPPSTWSTRDRTGAGLPPAPRIQRGGNSCQSGFSCRTPSRGPCPPWRSAG